MNFLMRSGTSQSVAVEQPSAHESPAVTRHRAPRPPSAPLEALIAEDPYPSRHTGGGGGGGGESGDDFAAENNADRDSSGAAEERATANHSDVSDDQGWITIPYKELPDDWSSAPDIESLHRLDRSFVFPGEQVHILACLSACTEEAEVITPFKVAAAMSKNGFGETPEKENGKMEDEEGDSSPRDSDPDKEKIEPKKDVANGELLFRMEDQKRKTEMLLQRFEKSHYFVRISESGEPLWSKKGDLNPSAESEGDGDKSIADGTRKTAKVASQINAVIDKGSFDPTLTGGAARHTVKCYSLANGDLVVLLQVNVGVEFLNDPVIEILQFEKYNERILTSSSENQSNVAFADQDPCGELLRWLLPLDNTLPPLDHPVTPINSSSGFGSTSQKPSLTASSSSQLFSFGNFRSYSMSSLPQNNAPALAAAKAISSKLSYDLEDWDQFSSQKLWKSRKTGSEGLLSFRGVSLERERFSVCCGLEGIYMPGRRWRRKVEIIQPVEIHSFGADCNTDDLLCVQIKNTSPAHTPDIEVYIDAITIVFEKASKGGQPISLSIACTEAGIDHSLPNLVLRRGEEHSFILKPATSLLKNIKGNSEKSTLSSQVPPANAASSLQMPSKTAEETSVSTVGQYAIMVSCRCNYTESRLFFKQPTSWRPRISRNLMISVASEISGQHGPTEGVYQLPVQVLNLQATNLTSEDLTLTVLAPASFTSPPSVVSLNSSPSSPMSPFVAFPEFTEKVSGEKHSSTVQRHSSAPVASGNQKQNANIGARSVSFSEQAPLKSDVIPSCGLCYTHLWLQSRVPLGCVPSQSSATIKLELLPLTNGIITLDTLQIDVKEKGLTYIPEHSLKINATSSISTAIV